jgi:hypothetical protein
VDRRLSYHKTCRCPEVPAIITAPPPLKVIPKGLFTAEFIARLMIEKYVLGRPLRRIGAAMHMEGLFAAILWTITATAARANLNPLTCLIDYLTACAHNGGKHLKGEALDRFLPWMMAEADKKAWAIGRAP